VDDSDNPINITTLEIYEYALRLLDEKGIKWRVLFGQKKGQHYSHQTIQEIAEGDFIFRIDDDEMAEPDCLEKLYKLMEYDVGAVAPLVLLPQARRVNINTPGHPDDLLTNSIADIWQPNIQWLKWRGTKEVDHLYSCFLYRKGIVKYELSLSNKAHREETIFTHSLKRASYKLIINADAKVWHWQKRTGGIRSDDKREDYNHDEGIFAGFLSLWGVAKDERKMVVLDCGIGDHWAFKNILPEMYAKYGKLTIAACFPDVFWDEPDLKLISIQEAKNMYGDITPFQVYKLLWDNKEKIHLIDAFKKLYL
jgi:glycosyltransferase involved in cell wall biosynthesis